MRIQAFLLFHRTVGTGVRKYHSFWLDEEGIYTFLETQLDRNDLLVVDENSPDEQTWSPIMNHVWEIRRIYSKDKLNVGTTKTLQALAKTA